MTVDTKSTGDPVLKIDLDFPVTYGKEGSEQTVSELVFDRRPKAKDFKGLNASGNLTFDEAFLLVSRLTAVPVHVINELDIADVTKVMKGVTSFLPDGLEIGGSQ